MRHTKRTLEYKEMVNQMRECLKGYPHKIEQKNIEDIKLYLAENSFSGTAIFCCLKIVGGKLDYVLPTIKLEESDNEKEPIHEADLKDRNVSLCAFLDTTRPRVDESLTVRLRVTYNRTPKYYTTSINLNEDDWIKLTTTNPRNGLKKAKTIINDLLKEAYVSITAKNNFSFDDFEKHFLGKGLNYNNVFNAINNHILYLKDNDKYGTASTFETALSSFKRFYLFSKNIDEKSIERKEFYNSEYWNKKELKFSSITKKWLESYVYWMESIGNGRSSISMNIRALRKIFNDGIADGELKNVSYPFQGKDKFEIPEHHNNKRPLPMEYIQAIYECDPIIDEKVGKLHRDELKYYRDMWIFSYLCYGVNPKDICRFKPSMIDDKYIEYTREKTKGEKRTFEIRIMLTDEHKRILEKYGSNKNDYVFGIINDTMNEAEKKKAEKLFTRNVSKGMKRIAGLLRFDEKTVKHISWQFSRHTFRTICSEAGIQEAVVQQCMGHIQSLGVSGNYNTITDNTFKKVNEAIMPFLHKERLTKAEEKILSKLSEDMQEIFLEMTKEERTSFVKEYMFKSMEVS